jgi:pimeloyl-ACP methyl ester carboxylesterase
MERSLNNTITISPVPERCLKSDVPQAQVHVLDAGHFALDTAADEIADLVRPFLLSR